MNTAEAQPQTARIEAESLREATRLTAGFDFYKPTMSQLAYELEPDAEVAFTFKNRGNQRLLDYVDPKRLQARFDQLRSIGFGEDELEYLGDLKNQNGESLFDVGYLDYLRRNHLPPVEVGIGEDLEVNARGEWPMVSFWETIVMSEISEAYFDGLIRASGLDIEDIYQEGDRRLEEKIAILQANPDIKLAEFGTRRRFSLRWQLHVLERLLNECPDNMLGTSNVGLAQTYGVKPVGTFAHEMPMVYCALADSRGEDMRAAHSKFLDSWYERYGADYSIALSDTFGSDFFFEDFTPEQAKQWWGLRHDSGDPIQFGEKAIGFYESLGINPLEKTVLFSDGLKMDDILTLYRYFQGRINVAFGPGTSQTNDLGLEPLNIVMKATEVNGTPTVKLSDTPGKYTGPDSYIARYQQIFKAREGVLEI